MLKVKPLPFTEAEKILGAKIPLTKEEYDALDTKLRFRAFTVARLTELDAINRVKEKLLKAVKEGKTLKEWWEESGRDQILQKAGFSRQNPYYWETVFRTNIQSSYNAGRAYQIKNSTTIKYLEFVGIRDSRQTPICRSRTGIIRPADDPWWQRNWPPLHFNCRSTVRVITEKQAKIEKPKITPPEKLQKVAPPLPGFGYDPIESGSFWKMPVSMLKRAVKYDILNEIYDLRKFFMIKDFEMNPTFKPLNPEELFQGLKFESAKDVDEFLKRFSEKNPHFFKWGYKEFIVSEMPSDTVMATTRGKFYCNKTELPNLLSALKKAKKGEVLNKSETDALISLLHEICHNRRVYDFLNIHVNKKFQILTNELTNEIITYYYWPDFLKTLGIKQKNVYNFGSFFETPGYESVKKNFKELLKFFGIKFSKTLVKQIVDTTIKGNTPYHVFSSLSELFAQNARFKIKDIDSGIDFFYFVQDVLKSALEKTPKEFAELLKELKKKRTKI